MDLEMWLRYIYKAIINQDPQISWLFIPNSAYTYTVWVTEDDKHIGVEFVRSTKLHRSYEELEQEAICKLSKLNKEVPKGYTLEQ